MNGKKAKALRRITHSRTEYQEGKRYYHAIARRAAQRTRPAAKDGKRRFPGAPPTAKSTSEHTLRTAVLRCIRAGYKPNWRIRHAIPSSHRHLARLRHTSLDRLWAIMPRPVILQTMRNLEAV